MTPKLIYVIQHLFQPGVLQPGPMSPPRGQHLSMSGYIFNCQNLGSEDRIGIQWTGARDGAKRPTIHRSAPQQRTNQPKMLVQLRSRNPDKHLSICSFIELMFIDNLSCTIHYAKYFEEDKVVLYLQRQTRYGSCIHHIYRDKTFV